jgi:hypothetical protein
MTHSELEEIGKKLFGDKWQYRLAHLLRLHHMTVWRWYKGRSSIPEHTVMLIRLLAEDPSHIKRLDSDGWRKRTDDSRRRAANAAHIALRAGVIARQPCEVCGKEGSEVMQNGQRRGIVQMHHDDYNKPLDVRWLCRKHHRSWHADNRPVDMTPELMRLEPLELFQRSLRERGQRAVMKGKRVVKVE